MKAIRILLILVVLTGIYHVNQAQSIKKIVIDAGHGGKDPGALGVNGIKEKDIVLNVALKVGTYIEQKIPNIEVVYTRDGDYFKELHERATIANDGKADLFISIHANSSAKPHVHGSETYVLGLHKEEANLEVAMRENAVVNLEENKNAHYNIEPNSPEWHIMLASLQSENLEQSIELADRIERQFKERVHRNSRGVHQAGFYVLYKTTMPSVLVELGFLTNEQEANFLNSELGQDYMASAIFRAVRDYVNNINLLISENDLTQKIEEEKRGNVIYRVQLYASQVEADKNHRIWNDFNDLYTEDNGKGVLRHIYGNFKNYNEASKELLNANKLGYKGAFVIAYKNGVRTAVNDIVTTTNTH